MRKKQTAKERKRAERIMEVRGTLEAVYAGGAWALQRIQ